MIKKLKKLFTSKREGKRDFSSFFHDASPEERRKVMEEVVRKANADQRALMEKYERTNHQAA